MEQFAIFYEYIACLLGFLVSGILVFINKEPSHSKNVLAISMFLLSSTGLVGVLFLDGSFLKYPFLFRINQPFTLFVLPATYIYIRSVLHGETRFLKTDWLLVLPAVLCAINLMPFYLLPIEEKRYIISHQLQNPALQLKINEGYLPSYVFSFLRLGWSACFVVINYKLIGQFKKRVNELVLFNNKELLQWLSILNSLYALLLFVLLIASIIAPIQKIGVSIVDLTVGIILSFISVQLFMRPRLLYGIFHPVLDDFNSEADKTSNQANSLGNNNISGNNLTNTDAKTPNPEFPTSKSGISKKDNLKYKQIIETYFLEKAPFLQVDYSLDQLMIDTYIPRYILSAFINREYGMGFREFLNRYRVNYFKENLNNPAWENYTLEAIAAKCGFSSRSTFISNFKQISGQTPSEYIKGLKKKGIQQI